MQHSAMFISMTAALAVTVGAVEYEWAGVFEVPEDIYMWTAQKVDGNYADPAMKIAALPASDATAEALDALTGAGETALGSSCPEIQPGDVIAPGEGACYTLKFNEDLWQSLYTIDASNVTHVAFFAEHVPTEFESTAHYLKDSKGEDIEPQAELPADSDEPAKIEWAASIGAAIIVNLILLFESTHLIAVGWEEEVDALWRWGTMILAGFLLPAVVDSMVAVAEGARGKGNAEASAEDGGDEAKGKTNRSRARLISAVAIGDFFHNLCDGFFIGAAFKGCGKYFGWKVSVATVLHEIPQELADYAVLTSPAVGFNALKALFINFLSGLSVVLGVAVINVSAVDDASVGLLLAFGGGTYVYLAATECMPKVHQLPLTARVHVLCLFVFILGAILIGLILLDHKHCVPGGGHAHGH